MSKMKKYLQRDFEFMFVINILFLIPSIFITLNAIYIGARLLIILFLGFGISYAKKGEKTAGIFGVIVSVLMILSGSFVTLLLGVFMFIHSIIYLNNYNK